MLRNIFILVITILNSNGVEYSNEDTDWQGKWFPYPPGTPDLNSEYVGARNTADAELQDAKHSIKMGVRDDRCDDGKTNLELDWYMNPENYTCYEDKNLYLPRNGIQPIHTTEPVPPLYNAQHYCMNESIHYSQVLPTFGSHRPLWAYYGGYVFLPRQRWLHNLEHGALVMVYHPCANKNEVEYLKKIVKSCLYRHVITPYNLLPPERPIALVTWGHRLEMSKVSLEMVINFIRSHALKGPEKTSREGQYNLMLKQRAKVVTDRDDNGLCPFYESFEITHM